jgi:hypothetical protein
MSISFQQNGLSKTLSANTTSGSTLTTIAATGVTSIGAFMIDNLDAANAVIVNVGYANTITANSVAGTGFAVPARSTKFVNLTQQNNFTAQPATAYLAANAVTGTASVVFTPVYIFK